MPSTAFRIATTLIIAGIAIAGLALILLVIPLNGPQLVEIVPTLTGKAERCLSCHNGIESMGTAHPVAQFGCVTCHSGDPNAITQFDAHKGVILNPGSFESSEKYCGNCHPAQAALAPTSIMGTYAGAIALVRRAFGLQTDSIAHYATTNIGHLQQFTSSTIDPAPIQKFSERCLTCHLNGAPAPQPYQYRSTGCSACHVLYSNDGLYKGADPTIPKDQPGHASYHDITKTIPYTQCNHCHNQGNYDLRTMAFLPRTDMPTTPIPYDPHNQTQRLHDYYQPIGKFTQCEWKLDCVDCHTKLEVMGDGTLYNNRSEAQYVQCQTCHGNLTNLPLQSTVKDPKGLESYPPHPEKTIILTARGEELPHIVYEGGKWILTAKVTGSQYEMPLVKGSQCQQKPDQQASRYCHECHSVDRNNPNP